MKVPRRRERIVDLIGEQGRVSVDALAGLLGVSRETVRRDLGELAAKGRIRKVHGGAILPESGQEGPFAARLTQSAPEKRRAARAAAALFQDGDSLFVDVGTTTLLFAEELARRACPTVITNGPDIARLFAAAGGRVFLIGGDYRPDAAEALGGLALAQIAGFRAGHAVLTVGGLSEAGATDFDLEEAEVARAMAARARTITVVCDSSKLGREALFQVCPLDALHRLVVDRAPPLSIARALRDAGVEVVVADPEPPPERSPVQSQ